MFGEEPYGNYNRIMLSNVLAGLESEEAIFLNSMAWYRENAITLHAGVRVGRIDRHARTVRATDGSRTPYDALVIATGSSAFVPDIPGMRTVGRGFHQGVFRFRTLDDTRAMIRYARTHKRAVVIGGGLLGLEAARGLQTHGVDVTVVHGPGHLMNQQLDAAGGYVLRRGVETLGIAVVTSARTVGVLGDTEITGVQLADGRVLPCDMVVVAAGIRANSSVAATSGFLVERGIVVDDQMHALDDQGTPDPAVFAVGECVQHRDQVYGLVAPLWEQARVLADVLTGTDPSAQYHGSRTATKLKVAGIDVASMGVTAPERPDDDHIIVSEPRRGLYKSVVVRDDRLIGATLVGRPREGRAPHPGVRPRLAAARGPHRAAVRPRHRARRGGRRGAARRDDRLQLQRRQQGHDRGVRARRRRLRGGRHGRDPRRQGLRVVQVARRAGRRVGRRR